MDAFKTLENQLKAVTVVLGIITIGLTSASRYSVIDADNFVLAMVILAFLFSGALVILLLLKKLPDSDLFRKIELISHLVFAILLIIAWIVFAIKTSDFTGATLDLFPEMKKQRNIRWVALVFGIVNVAVYGCISFFIFQRIKK